MRQIDQPVISFTRVEEEVFRDTLKCLTLFESYPLTVLPGKFTNEEFMRSCLKQDTLISWLYFCVRNEFLGHTYIFSTICVWRNFSSFIIYKSV